MMDRPTSSGGLIGAGAGAGAGAVVEGRWTPQLLLASSFKDLGSPPQVGRRFQRHLLQSDRYLKSLLSLLKVEPSTTRDFSLDISCFDLNSRDPVLGNQLLRYPHILIPLLEDAIVEAQREVKGHVEAIAAAAAAAADADAGAGADADAAAGGLPSLIVKGEGGSAGLTRIHARLTHLPPHLSCCKPSISSLSASDTNRIVQVAGTCVKASGVHMYESTRAYKCTDRKCGHVFCVYADLEQRGNAIQVPRVCPSPSVPGGGGPCKSNRFEVMEGQAVHTDYQEVKIQESGGWSGGVGGRRVGAVPRSLLVKLQHDLVDRCQPGDEIVAVGCLISQWAGEACDVGVALNAHSIRVINAEDHAHWDDGNQASSGSVQGAGAVQDEMRREFDELWDSSGARTHPIAVRNMICSAVCPRLYGLSLVKLGMLVTLIGGGGSTARRSGPDEVDATTDSGDVEENAGGDQPEQFHVATSGGGGVSTTQQDYGFGRSSQTQSQSSPVHPRDGREGRSVQTRRRDQSHMLLVGDPGTGKSQFLRFAAALCPRSVMTTGTGTTSAGLTCAAVREGRGGEYALEAGALVLADKGVCCIDEFGCIRAEERTTIHEAMEQQTISVAKAGIVCKLNCRATVVAVTNAKGGIYDHDKTLMQNTGIDPPLLSRFDLIFRLVDDSNSARDEKIAIFLLNNAIEGFGYECQTDNTTTDKVWNTEKLRAYIATVKSRFHPSLCKDAALLLERHYQECRQSRSSTVTVTVRFLESLIRLSQAHARLMYRNVVTLQDAAATILLMECSAGTLNGYNPNFSESCSLYRDPMATAFAEAEVADIEFLCDEYKLLDRYDMLDRLNDEERRAVWQYEHNRSPPSDPRPPGHGINEDVIGSFIDQCHGINDQATQPQCEGVLYTKDHYDRVNSSTRKIPQQSAYDPDADYLMRLERHSSAASLTQEQYPGIQSGKENELRGDGRDNNFHTRPRSQNYKRRRRAAD